MKKKILCLILAVLLLMGTLPLSVLAAEVRDAVSQNTKPSVTVTSLYSYSETSPNEFRALPDKEGNFYLDIALDKAPTNNENIVVYYRTVDDSAVSAWGDYESVGTAEEAYVTLTKANGYKARVTIESIVLDDGFVTNGEDGKIAENKIISRRFLFEVTRVEGEAELDAAKSELYCYLRSSRYHYQDNTAHTNTDAWGTDFEKYLLEYVSKEYEDNKDDPEALKAVEEMLDRLETEHGIKYDTFYYTLGGAYSEIPPISTPKIKYKGSHSDAINLRLDDEWRNYVSSDWVNLGISINGLITRDFWDSEGPATFNLYYTYEGEKKLALTLYLKGEFDDSRYFGWEYAFEYAIEGRDSGEIAKHMERNFIGFTLYDNDGKVAYEAKKTNGISDLCSQLKNAFLSGYATKMMSSSNWIHFRDSDITAYYLKLPSNFALADSYSYEFISDSEDVDEIRWLENVMLDFTLFANEQPRFSKDGKGNQMVITNLDTIKEGDPLRMSVRFDRPVYIADPNDKCYITVDIYNDKGACLAAGVKLYLKQLEGSEDNYYYYACDTLVFEGEFPNALQETKIASLRNIRIHDGKDDATDPTNGIRSFFTDIEILSRYINDIYIQKDFRTPVATIGAQPTDSWTKSKSIDLYVNVQGNNNARFNDYVTVYYQWTNSEATPSSYSSKVIFNTKEDGEILKTIIGTGNGEMYLHLKAVSSYGKSSCSHFGPFKFDNSAPTLSANGIAVTGSLKERTISIPLPNDNGGTGFRDISLYYVGKSGEGILLQKFTADNFTGDPKTLTHNISHTDVGVGVDADGNVVLERRAVEFYFVITDKLGNTSGKTGELAIVFDTNDYLEEEIGAVGPYDISSETGDAQFKSTTASYDKLTYIYNYKSNVGKTFKSYTGNDNKVYYAFAFTIKENAFNGPDSGNYDAKVYYKGVEIDDTSYRVVEPSSGVHVVLFHTEMNSGRYDIQLTRTVGETTQVSLVYSVYATNDEKDDTAIKNQIVSGTLLSNSVYQLSSEYPYFYYKDTNGAIQKVYYNNTKQPATFSSFAKAKEYVYFMELSDIYLVQLTTATANALSSGTTGYLIAKGETVTPQEGQFWIRYKSDAWTPTSGDSSWVYYYYGTSDELTEGALSANLQTALNAVANRITGYGRSVILTDTSLFLGSAQGDKMLDGYGMPYLNPGQIHNEDELSSETMCGNTWSIEIAFAADKNIYKSSISVGIEGEDDYEEYPIVGSFALPEDSSFEYMTYAQYNSSTPAWNKLVLKKGETFIDVLTASGVYYIREMSKDGISVYAIYIDKEAPQVSFSQTDDNGNLKEIPVDGVEVREIRTKDLYIGSIAAVEYDRLSYVAVYKVSNLSLVGIYTANELDLAPIKLDDGNYYIVVADRSGNHYTVTAKVSSTGLECTLKEYTDKFIKLTCNRRNDQILRYEVYLNGELVTSTYAPEQTFEKAGLYTVYIKDIYGNEYSKEHLFSRNYPTVTWKYRGADGKYHTYDPKDKNANGFVLTWVADNQYKISTAVETRFTFSGDYGYEFVGSNPKYKETYGTETTVTIEAGQSFTLKVYYKNHKDCYSIYSGVVDVTPPSINVSAEVDVVQNGEYSLFEEWVEKNSITMNELYFVLSEITRTTVANGGSINSDTIKINAADANNLSLVEVYLNGALVKKQDTKSGFSEIIVSDAGDYRIVAKDTLGNVSEFTFKNGSVDGFDVFVDGVEKEIDLHGYLNFNADKVYTKVDYGNTSFLLNIKEDADVFLSVSVSDGNTVIYGFRISNGHIYPLTYTINNNEIELSVGEAIDATVENFKVNKEFLISKTDEYAVYASIASDKTVSIKVYAPEDATKVVSVGARIELSGSNTMFVASELSGKGSNISLEGLGVQTGTDIKVNEGFTVDESLFESERVSSISLYYSKLNDLDVDSIKGKTNIYTADKQYSDEGFYLLIVRNHYGNEKVYRIAVSRSFGITSSVTFDDGHKIYYSKEHTGTLYSNKEITLDILDEGVTFTVTLNGAAYTEFTKKTEDGMTYLVFSAEGTYVVTLKDSYGNVITKQLEIKKSAYTVTDELLTGYNENALKRNEGYTNQKLSVDKAIYDRDGIYYLAIQYGDKLTVLFDAFSEIPVSTDEQYLANVIGADGDGVYKVICRNRYGAVVTKEIHYRGTPTLKLERTTRSKSEAEIYDLSYALSLGFWSNNTLSFSTDAKTYVFTINGKVSECPRTLVFENAGDYGNFEYEITYIDEYGFEYSFKAYLVRKSVDISISSGVTGTEIDGVLNTKQDVSITFGENTYATYTRNNGEEVIYHSGDVLKKDGTYRFTVIDYAGNATTITIKKDTAVEFSFTESVSGSVIPSGGIVNSSKVTFNSLNKDGAYIEKVILNGVVQKDFEGNKFTEDGKWEILVSDKLGNTSYYSFYIITRSQNGFAYTTPYEYRITEMWYDNGDGVKVSYMSFVNHTDYTSSFDFKENGTYIVVMTSDVTGLTTTFEFVVNTNAPEVSLVGCQNGETTLNDVTITGCKVGDRIKVYKITDKGEVLVEEIEVASLATKMPTITEGGEYRIVVESEAGVATELTFVRKHVMNTAGSVFIMVVIGLAVVGLFTGLIYRNKSKTDD